MPSLNLLVVGEEKALPEFEDALESCKRYVGPIKLFTAHKAVDAVSRLQKLVQTCGQCHAAFLSHHFTCPGKEDFSETLRKVVKEKYPDVPVVCWGNPKKGGELNKHFHATLEFNKHGSSDVNALVDVLKQVQAGQIRPDYLHKDQRKSLERRNSLDRSDSIRNGSGGMMGRTDSTLRRADSRRASAEGSRPAAVGGLERTGSIRRSIDEDGAAAAAGGGGLQSNPTLLRRKSLEQRPPAAGLDAYGIGGSGSLPSPAAVNGMGMGMGMGMAGMHLGGSMNSPMGAMNGGGGMGGPFNTGMGSLNRSSATMGSFNSATRGLGGLAMGPGNGMAAAVSMGGKSSVGMPPQPGMGVGLAAGAMNAQMGMGGGGGGGDMAAMMGSMSLGAGGCGAGTAAAAAPSANGELIRMLADEVVRLRKAVEEKRARDAEAAQLRELQQQQMLLQQQLAAMSGRGVGGGLHTSSAGLGVGSGGMPMGI